MRSSAPRRPPRRLRIAATSSGGPTSASVLYGMRGIAAARSEARLHADDAPAARLHLAAVGEWRGVHAGRALERAAAFERDVLVGCGAQLARLGVEHDAAGARVLALERRRRGTFAVLHRDV